MAKLFTKNLYDIKSKHHNTLDKYNLSVDLDGEVSFLKNGKTTTRFYFSYINTFGYHIFDAEDLENKFCGITCCRSKNPLTLAFFKKRDILQAILIDIYGNTTLYSLE
jgi:hypothetical protein